MSKFKPDDFKIIQESEKIGEIKIKALDLTKKPDIKAFEMRPLGKVGEEDYSQVKARYGPLAVTDSERNERPAKDRRFLLNPIVKEPLSVEQEERRVLEEKVRVRVQALADQAKAQAETLGYQDGLRKGYEEAFKKMQQEASERLAQFDRLVKSAENAKAEIFKANERFLIELVYRIARLVMLKELNLDQDYVLRLAKELISKIGIKDNITIRISTEDAKTIDLLKDGLEKSYGKFTNLNIEASSQLKRGDCQIETQWSAIDASIDSQLEGIYQALIGNPGGRGESV